MSWKFQVAEKLERQHALEGDYPSDWPLIAYRIKALARWQCERCKKVHELDGEDGFVLTVHHLDGNKWNCESWNLAALCQRCHLRVQSRIKDFYSIPYVFDSDAKIEVLSRHSSWMARHIKGYNVWAWLNDKPQFPLTKIEEKDYSKEWT